jgi:hypothetical protein
VALPKGQGEKTDKSIFLFPKAMALVSESRAPKVMHRALGKLCAADTAHKCRSQEQGFQREKNGDFRQDELELFPANKRSHSLRIVDRRRAPCPSKLVSLSFEMLGFAPMVMTWTQAAE